MDYEHGIDVAREHPERLAHLDLLYQVVVEDPDLRSRPRNKLLKHIDQLRAETPVTPEPEPDRPAVSAAETLPEASEPMPDELRRQALDARV